MPWKNAWLSIAVLGLHLASHDSGSRRGGKQKWLKLNWFRPGFRLTFWGCTVGCYIPVIHQHVAPENWCLEYFFPFLRRPISMGDYVSFREGYHQSLLETDWKWTFNTLHKGNLDNPINTPAEQKNNNNARLFIYPHSWRRCSVRSAEKNVGAKTKHSKDILSGSIEVPSWKLTYPTWGKGKSSSKWTFQGIC